MMDTLFSVEEAARRLGGISKWTVPAWLSQGRLLRTKVGGRTMIRESELTKVIEDGGKSPAPSRAEEPAETKTEDYRANGERLRRERRRRNAPA
jgi:excisionase family DNA binding protein